MSNQLYLEGYVYNLSKTICTPAYLAWYDALMAGGNVWEDKPCLDDLYQVNGDVWLQVKINDRLSSSTQMIGQVSTDYRNLIASLAGDWNYYENTTVPDQTTVTKVTGRNCTWVGTQPLYSLTVEGTVSGNLPPSQVVSLAAVPPGDVGGTFTATTFLNVHERTGDLTAPLVLVKLSKAINIPTNVVTDHFVWYGWAAQINYPVDTKLATILTGTGLEHFIRMENALEGEDQWRELEEGEILPAMRAMLYLPELVSHIQSLPTYMIVDPQYTLDATLASQYTLLPDLGDCLYKMYQSNETIANQSL